MPSHAQPDGRGVWIALPTYNERENLEPLTSEILRRLPAAHILVVDDASPDGTGAIADRLASEDDRVRVLHRPGKEGLGVAYRAAFSHLMARSDCSVVVQMDCDFSHRADDLVRMVSALGAANDLVLGSRYVPGGATPGWGRRRRILSRGGSIFARLVLGLPFHDLTGGFKAWRVELLRALPLDRVAARGYGFQVEMTWRAFRHGARIAELPISFEERAAGTSKMSGAIIAEALVMVIRLRMLRESPTDPPLPTPAPD
jgi:dolichol-phosphate mannosyltransferase